MNQNINAPKTLITLDGNTLMAQSYEPIRFSVEKILPHGLFILAGSPKIGKSWLSLDLCQAVATGGKLWDFSVEQGDVLYLALHHTRKMYDPAPLNTLSGSTGLVGSVDGVFVLEKEKRTSNTAKLTIANRDTEGFCFKLELDPENCKWQFLGNDIGDVPGEKKLAEKKDELLCLLVDDFLKDEWSGTATELSEALNAIDASSGVTPV